jgi:hypothetical protein
MPLRKFRYFPEDDDDAGALPRLAADHDAFVASPVHGMHENLWAFAENPPETPAGLYPGWIRLAVPLVASGGLWVVIFWALGYLR